MKRLISNIIIVVCILIVGVCGYKLYSYYKEYNTAKDEYKEIAKEVVKTKNQGKERTIDFNRLLKINQDVVGWVYAKGTGIDYPIVLTNDNEYYLHHTINRTVNSSGAIFLDYHDKADFSSEHTIVYGHHMKNGSMFAKLLKYRDNKFIKKHDAIEIYTPSEKIKLRVISAYARNAKQKIPVTFGDDYTISDYKKDILSRSDIQSRVSSKEIKKAKQIFTFVTCSYEGEDNRTFVHCIRVQ